MFIDALLVLADAQAITTTGASTNYIDTLAAGDGIEHGAWLLVLVKAAFTGTTSVKFDLRTDSAATFPTDTILISTGAIALASLTANTFIAKIRMPLGMKQFIRGYMTFIGTGTLGTVDIKIVKDIDRLVPGVGIN